MNIWHLTERKERPMSSITVGRENTDDIDIYYEHHGTGQPVVRIHGYPLNGHAWEKQERVVLQAGYRVITYDRRGFGQSSKPAVGYDYDTFADDLNSVADRPAYFKKSLDNLYNFDVLAGNRVSEQAWQNSFNVAVTASAHAAYACVDTWLTDFRDDLSRIDVPVLLIHGDADRILPYRNTSQRLPGLIADLTVLTVDGGPHNIGWNHPEVVINPALLEFLKT
jgi:pimeloyl-ACP methyl ester carboxylesterase